MTIELSLLKAMASREAMEKYVHLLNPKALSRESLELLKDYQAFFSSRDAQKIDFSEFSGFFFLERHPQMDDKTVEMYKGVINRLKDMPEDGKNCSQIISNFEQQDFYLQIQRDLDQNLDIDQIVSKMETARERIHRLRGAQEELEQDMDITLALDTTDRSKGLQWRLKCLQEVFEGGGLIKGDFGIIAGFVDMGKTSFICSEISHMAQQLEGDQYIAWLNTEGSWEQLIPRVYCATLNCSAQDLRKFPEKAKAAYMKKMKGNINRIRIMNFQRKSVRDVENLIKERPPSLIVFDLLDGLNGFEKYMKGDGGAHERYNHLYQWAREIATQHCPVLAVSQLNGDGNNEAYPTITNLRGSRVDKQAAATFQLIIGGLEGNSTERYLSLPKNKITSNKGFRAQVKFDPIRSRFSD